MNKYLAILILAAAVLAGFSLWGGGSKDSAALPTDNQLEKQSLLTAGNTEYDFGTISMKDGTVKTAFSVSNSSGKDVRIDSIVTSCMCTTAYLLKEGVKRGPFGMPGHGNTVPRVNEVIRSGEEWIIEVIFDPAAHGPLGAGLAERSVYLVDENGAALELKTRAEVTL